MIGQSIAHYTITEKIGQGGMGEVYRATDTKLKRDVALKVLPESFTQDPQRMARFTREAQVLASLNHPNIGAIHGLEEEDGVRALVLELIEGEELLERIAKGPIPLEESLQIALQIAEALEAAHEKGIIHRDLKPANVKVTPEGQVKVLDFGLAKAIEEAPENSPEMTHSPTLTMQATQAGIIMGTAAYMSPEQAKGLMADQRSDIWSFGAVVFEMLAGQQPFAGDDITEVLASVVKVDVDWDALPSEVPTPVLRWLRRCLRADPKQRYHSIADIRLDIQDYLENPEADSTASLQASVPSWSLPLTWLTAVGVLILAVLATWFLKPTPEIPEVPLTRTAITAEQLQEGPIRPVISPDGNKLIYGAAGQLRLRHLDRFEADPLPDSDGSGWPYFSPDSAFMAYSQDDKLWKVNLSTGGKTTLCDLPTEMIGGTWAEDGSIVFGSFNGGLYEVSDQGGDPQLLLEPDPQKGETGLVWPHYLPKKRGLVFTVWHSGDDYVDLYVDGKRTTLLKQEGAVFWETTYSPSGHLLYRRLGRNAGLWAVPFSLSSLEIEGPAFLVDPTGAWPSVSDDGRLSYFKGAASNRLELVQVDRGGQVQGTLGQPQEDMYEPALSPDDKWVAVSALEKGNRDIWLHNLESGSKRRPSFLEGEGRGPVWTAGGDRVAFHTNPESGWEIWIRPSDNSSDAVKITEGSNPHFSADGRYLVFGRQSQETGWDLWYLELGNENEPQPFLGTDHIEGIPRLSSDSRWIAYVSDDSGQTQIYVKKFPSGEGLWQMSTNGGNHPRWSPDGDELFYLEGQDLMAVSVKGTESLDHGTPVKLFTILARISHSLCFSARKAGI